MCQECVVAGVAAASVVGFYRRTILAWLLDKWRSLRFHYA